MTPVALALSVLNASGQPADLGVVMASQILPQLALLLAGGAIADWFRAARSCGCLTSARD